MGANLRTHLYHIRCTCKTKRVYNFFVTVMYYYYIYMYSRTYTRVLDRNNIGPDFSIFSLIVERTVMLRE